MLLYPSLLLLLIGLRSEAFHNLEDEDEHPEENDAEIWNTNCPDSKVILLTHPIGTDCFDSIHYHVEVTMAVTKPVIKLPLC